jgi:hypothetical protein
MSFINGDSSGFTPLDPTALATGLTISAVSGNTSPSLTGLQVIQTNATVHGNFLDLAGTVSFTASAATAVFDLVLPSGLTNAFTSTTQATGVVVVTSGTALGSLTSIATVSGAFSVRVILALGGTSGTYTANFIIKVQMQ